MGKYGNGNNGAPPTRIMRNDPTKKMGAASSKTDGETDTVKISNPGVDKPTERIAAEDTPSNSEGFREVQGSMSTEAGSSTVLSRSTPEFMSRESVVNPKTRVFRSGVSNDSPVVGWLVVVKGAGLGSALEFSYGNNAIGRDTSQAISVGFGDEGISRESHAFVEYDPKARACFLSKGSNLVYVNGARVGQGAEVTLKNGDNIELGETVLRFVSFCCADFCWTDSE